MFRFLLRVLAVFCLATAVLFTVIDLTQSVGISAFVFTPLATSWANFMPNTLSAFLQWCNETLPEFVNTSLVESLLSIPTSLVFALFALFLYVIGYKRRSHGSVFVDR